MDSKIPKFRRFVLQNFPFIEQDFDALTDYALICKVVEYLNKVITQTNANSEQVEALTNAFNELKDYVDHYFDNLDVQDEINHKLDEMAESGQLTDIIAQYLSLGAILGYPTLTDMSAAENLVDGSICKVLENDGIYKVRPITNTDDVDGYFIVALYDQSLVAERIDNGELDRRYYLGAFHKKYSEHDKRTYLFLSSDAVNWSKIPNIEIHGQSSSGGGDPSIVYDPESKYFMVAYSNQDTSPNVQCFTIMRSKDLETWTEHPISLTLPPSIQGYNKWAPDFFRGADGKLYIIFSADKTQNGYDFEGLITELTDVENLTFTNPYIITRDNPDQEYDYSIRHFNNKYYMVASDMGVIKLYTSTDLQNFTLVNSNLCYTERSINTIGSTEGCNLEVINGKLYVYFEYYNLGRYAVAEINTSTNKIVKPEFMNSLQGYKHGSVMNLDNNHAIAVVNNVAKNIVDDNDLVAMNYERFLITLTQDTTLPFFTLLPNQILIVQGNGHKLTITRIEDPYKVWKLNFLIYDANGTLEIGNYEGDQYSTYTYTASAGTAKKLKTVDFSFNALDNSYDYLVKGISGTIPISTANISGNVYYRQNGGVMNVTLNIDVTGISSTTEVCTLPSAFTPHQRVVTPLANRTTEGTCNSLITDGTPKLYITTTNNGTIQGNITYIV